MPGDVGLRSAIAGLDLETSMVECVHLCARTQTRARRSSGAPLQVEARGTASPAEIIENDLQQADFAHRKLKPRAATENTTQCAARWCAGQGWCGRLNPDWS